MPKLDIIRYAVKNALIKNGGQLLTILLV